MKKLIHHRPLLPCAQIYAAAGHILEGHLVRRQDADPGQHRPLSARPSFIGGGVTDELGANKGLLC